ncbi:uncharacterized protein BCR38DRAFT_348580 [Pseudomassariella vexata]|uniref:DUF4185 domain-containing protein n=1 Tax=Pseudomassariella vexata TaxID=1141098 RepID=A0A1Y2DRK5_9PEZI|nr:uncharacterized protein BCR38DRAFT_348580 [Pseudomassariella vexata]ORY61774.1 hypothetical protein BCR38DRAFT_348580 [Pseudomassariella vexata]
MSFSLAAPFVKSVNTAAQRADNTQAAGVNPITLFKTEYLGIQLADNSASHRDLGFTGELGGKWYAIYGDTLWCAPGVSHPSHDAEGFHGMVRDSISECTNDPLRVHDLHLNADGRQKQFIPFNSSWGETNLHGFGGTSLVETDKETATGAVYYLVVRVKSGLVGAGIAKVEMVNGAPTVTKRYGSKGYWWPSDKVARYGDVATFKDHKSDYIYLWGGAPTSMDGFLVESYVYQARVRAADAFDFGSYEYWWGRARGWRSVPLTEFTTETAVMWNSGQGQVVWSPFFSCYIFVHLGPGSNDVYLRTAPSPEGPWSPDVKVFTATPIDGGMTYAGVAHPYLDESGQTLTISYTNNNNIEVLKVSFYKAGTI